jgi:hypothetical protein
MTAKTKERRIIMKSTLFLSCALILDGALAIAQTPLTAYQQLTTGVVGLTPGQTARIHVLYPTAPAPILQPPCSVTLNIADDQGTILKTVTVSQFVAGRSASLDLNADTDLTGSPRTEIHGFSVAPAGCDFTGTLELIDNITQKTVLVIGSRQTYPAEHRAVWSVGGSGSMVCVSTVSNEGSASMRPGVPPGQ